VPAEVVFRPATAADLPAILVLLADDDIARERASYVGSPAGSAGSSAPGGSLPVVAGVPGAVGAAFAAIDADPRNELVVADEDGLVVGTCQLTFIPGLSRGGAERMTIEAVRVRADRRGGGLGRRMMAYALGRARERGCALAQLTTDKRRADAHRFYESLGFVASHEGMKLPL
jgi:GNAT superfamily N-acetyltransferase